MQTAETFLVARDAARAIVERGLMTDVEVVGLSGAIGGREYNPIEGHFHAVAYRDQHDSECFKFWPGDDMREPERATYVVNGRGMYVTGWQGSGDGTASRASGGYVLLGAIGSGLILLPRRAYVLSSSPIPALYGQPF